MVEEKILIDAMRTEGPGKRGQTPNPISRFATIVPISAKENGGRPHSARVGSIASSWPIGMPPAAFSLGCPDEKVWPFGKQRDRPRKG